MLNLQCVRGCDVVLFGTRSVAPDLSFRMEWCCGIYGVHNRQCVRGCDVVLFGISSVAPESSYLQAAEDLVRLTVGGSSLPAPANCVLVGRSGVSGALFVCEAILRFVLVINEYLAF